MFSHLLGYDIFGVNSQRLHWSEKAVSKVRELNDESSVNGPFEYESVWELLDRELPSSLAYHIDGDAAYIGIPASYPFDMTDEVYRLRTRKEAADFVAKAVSPLFSDGFDDISSACGMYAGVDE